MPSTKKKKKYRNVKPGVGPGLSKVEGKISSKRTSPVKAEPFLPGKWQTNTGIFFMLVLTTTVFYSGDLHLGFFSVDDPDYVINNPWIKGISSDNIQHIVGAPYFANYSPVHLLSYMFDHSIAGENAYGFHLSSNIWAGVTTGFVYFTALVFTRSNIPAVIASILFLVHPVHVEAIAWISSRKDLVAAGFALPSFLTYMKYRHENQTVKGWYFLSLFLFALAVAGKLSVATFPAVYFLWDWVVEKKSFVRSLLDKIPFLIVGVLVAGVAAAAQPAMGNKPYLLVIAIALIQNLWLLTGFATYVIYRMPPETGNGVAEVVSAILLLGAFVAPFLLCAKRPKTAVLIYWILLAFIPTQVLSFSHPVTDRYVFFPSVAAMILLAWSLSLLVKRFGRRGTVICISIVASLVLFWSKSSLDYLAEWKDPRSVWYAAVSKTTDPVAYQNLGSFYLGQADKVSAGQAQKTQVDEQLNRLVTVVWTNDPRAAKLLSQWNTGQHSTPEENTFSDTLRSLAWTAFDGALQRKGNKVMPGVYYNRGLILLNRGLLDSAEKQFYLALDEVSREPFPQVREQLTVYSHVDLGIIAWKKVNYQEALKWFKMAEEEQDQFGTVWFPAAAENRKRLEQIVSQHPAH